jgi:hypothetical protein
MSKWNSRSWAPDVRRRRRWSAAEIGKREGETEMSLFAWLRSRKEAARLVQADASSLISRFGDNAYYAFRPANAALRSHSDNAVLSSCASREGAIERHL